MFPEIKNQFLRTYLEYVEETETPRIMHIWCAIAGVGACLGRKAWIPFGVKNVYGNMYVLLEGPPAVRKTTAIDIITDRIRNATAVKFAPTDTGGARQGLIKAMAGDELNVSENDERLIASALNGIDIAALGSIHVKLDARDEHVLFAASGEFGSFMGTKSTDMPTFLIRVWDGKDYDYITNTQKRVLKNPLLSILGGTTSTDIAETFAAASVGKGFTSRIVFVHANKKYKKVSRPPDFDQVLEKEIEKTLSTIYNKIDGEIRENAEAIQLNDFLYDKQIALNDSRFLSYANRRQQHLMKTSMILAVMRLSQTITFDDMTEANEILTYTEQFMPDALGQYGLSPLAAAKQKMLEFCMHANGPVPKKLLWIAMQRDMKWIDFENSVQDLINADKLSAVQTSIGEALVFNDGKTEHVEQILNIVAGDL